MINVLIIFIFVFLVFSILLVNLISEKISVLIKQQEKIIKLVEQNKKKDEE